MLNEKCREVLKHEGVVAIVTSNSEGGVHVVNTWNSYIHINEKEQLLIPAGRMHQTESNVKENGKALLTFGSRQVEGFHSMGTGFLLTSGAHFASEGSDFDLMKSKFPWMRAVLIITIHSVERTL